MVCPVCYKGYDQRGERTCGHYLEKPISEELMWECIRAFQDGQDAAIKAAARKHGFDLDKSGK